MDKQNTYELMIVLKPQLPENVRMGIESKILEMLETADGKVSKVDAWGKKHLAYKIAGHNEGYYIVYEFKTAPARVEAIEKSLKLNKDVLRYLIVNEDK